MGLHLPRLRTQMEMAFNVLAVNYTLYRRKRFKGTTNELRPFKIDCLFCASTHIHPWSFGKQHLGYRWFNI